MSYPYSRIVLRLAQVLMQNRNKNMRIALKKGEAPYELLLSISLAPFLYSAY